MQRLVDLLTIISTGVLRRTISVARGFSISALVVRAPALSTTHSSCVRFGLFNNLVIYQFSEAVSRTPIKKIRMSL